MSRVTSLPRPRSWRSLAAGLCLGLFGASASMPVGAAELPPCGDDRIHDCRLPDWSAAVQRSIPSLFGRIDGLVWVDDDSGDAPSGGLDILGVGLGRVEISDPDPIRESDDLLKLGKVKKAVQRGPGVLVRVVLDRPVDQVAGGHSSVHIATDIDGSRSDNAPTGVADPDNPFAGSGDVYSLTWASTTGKTRLLDTDLSRGWYQDEDPFAAAWAAPGVLDVLVAPEAFGEGFRVVSHVSGSGGGYDLVGLGPGFIPADGRTGLIPSCVEGSIDAQTFVVRRLVENGQTLREVEAPASWRGGAAVPIEGDDRAALAALIEERDGDGDGRISLGSTISLFEDGVVIGQRPGIALALEGDLAYVALELGLTRRGFNVLRDIDLKGTGNTELDAWLERATDALSETMPPFRSGKKAGLVAGEAVGACIPWIKPPAQPVVEPSPGPTADDAAPSA